MSRQKKTKFQRAKSLKAGDMIHVEWKGGALVLIREWPMLGHIAQLIYRSHEKLWLVFDQQQGRLDIFPTMRRGWRWEKLA